MLQGRGWQPDLNLMMYGNAAGRQHGATCAILGRWRLSQAAAPCSAGSVWEADDASHLQFSPSRCLQSLVLQLLQYTVLAAVAVPQKLLKAMCAGGHVSNASSCMV